MMGPAGPITGPFTVSPDPNGDPSNPDPAGHTRTFRITFPTQMLSGTYVVTLGSGIKDIHGNALDTNLNAGLDQLRGINPNGTTTPVTVVSPSQNVPIPDATAGGPGVLSSTLTVTDDFLIQGLTLTLNVAHARVTDLRGMLIGPNGETVQL